MELTKFNKEMNENLRVAMRNKFQQFGLLEESKQVMNWDDNDIIKALHFGFSEKAFFESIRGELIATPFTLSNIIPPSKDGGF